MRRREVPVEMLAVLADSRTDFSRGPVESIVIDRKAVAKVSWRGREEGYASHGVMYCYIHGPRIISFRTQDFDSAPPEDMAAAVRAFETAWLGDAR